MRLALLFVALCSAVASSQARATETEALQVSFSELNAGLEKLQTENAALRHRITTLETIADSNYAPAAACSPACCDASCLEPCCDCGPVLSGGVGFYFLQSYWENNPAYGTFNVVNNPSTYSQIDFDWDVETAWDFWLETVGSSGLGTRFRYWQFDNGLSETPAISQDGNDGVVLPRPLGLEINSFGGPHTFQFASGLEIHVIDLEVLKQFRHRNWQWEASTGIRIASTTQEYYGARLNNPAPIAVRMRHDFDGVGPMLGLSGRRVLGSSGLSLFARSRTALLFGDVDEIGTVTIVNANAVSSAANASRTDLMPVAEMELGAAFNRDLGAATAFIELAWVANVWFGAGNSSNTGPLQAGGPTNITTFPLITSNNNDNLGLMGGRLSAGLRY